MRYLFSGGLVGLRRNNQKWRVRDKKEEEKADFGSKPRAEGCAAPMTGSVPGPSARPDPDPPAWREVSAVTSIRVDPRVQEVTWARKQELNSS